MDRIESRLNTNSEEFRRNRDAMDALVKRLRDEIERIRLGGPAAARERHVERGKLLARDRVKKLLDPGSPFLELSPLAAFGMYDGDSPSASIITGIGRIHGRETVVVANDATVKGGTYFPMTVKKHLRAQQIAIENHAPVRLPGRFGRRVPAVAGRDFSRSGSLRAHLLQPGADVRDRPGAGRDRDGQLHGRRRVRARDVRRERHRPRAGHDLPGWTAAGARRNRRGGQRRGPWRRRRAYAPVRRERSPGRRRRARAPDCARDLRESRALAPPPRSSRTPPRIRTTIPPNCTASSRPIRAGPTTCAR